MNEEEKCVLVNESGHVAPNQWCVTALSSESYGSWLVIAPTAACAERKVRNGLTDFERRRFSDGFSVEPVMP